MRATQGPLQLQLLLRLWWQHSQGVPGATRHQRHSRGIAATHHRGGAAAGPQEGPQEGLPLYASQAKLKVPAAPAPPALSPAPAADKVDKERASADKEGDSSDDEPEGSDSEKEAENSSSVEEEEEEEEEEEDSEDGDFIDDASDSD